MLSKGSSPALSAEGGPRLVQLHAYAGQPERAGGHTLTSFTAIRKRRVDRDQTCTHMWKTKTHVCTVVLMCVQTPSATSRRTHMWKTITHMWKRV